MRGKAGSSSFHVSPLSLVSHNLPPVVPKQTWQEIVDMITDGLRSGQACEALCLAIDRCGHLLAEQFPARPEDLDELPNLIID